jgi:hypothetical protein
MVDPVGRPVLCGGLRRRLPRDEFPAFRRFCPGIEEHEPQAARLAVDLHLDRGTPGDECGVARQTHLAQRPATVAKSSDTNSMRAPGTQRTDTPADEKMRWGS